MDDTNPTAMDAALDQLMKLIAAGAPADVVTREIGAIVAGWAEEPEMSPGAAQVRIEHMWDSVSKDAADLQEQLADFAGEDAQAAGQAHRVLAAMNAAVAALAAAHGAMG